MTARSDVAIVGAGPYGLSIATHLRDAGVTFRIFGSPMEVWCEHMPDGMILKSDGFASNLSDPGATFTLKHFCDATGTPYHDLTIPIRLETFRSYGLTFQQRLVPELEKRQVTRIERDAHGYRLDLDDGSEAHARRVVLAIGISHFQHVPPILSELPVEFASHSSAHRNLGAFRGRDVTVIGGGASAIDTAVLLNDAGAKVTLVARRSYVKFSDPPPPDGRSLWQTMRHPGSPIGPGWRSRMYSEFPGLFRLLPQTLRRRIVTKHNGPGAGWPMKERFIGKVPALLGYDVQQAEMSAGHVRLVLAGRGATREHITSHVIAATGYKVDVRRLAFLSRHILSLLRTIDHTPILSSDFESSVAGLYFVGAASANSFGPMMRFACGAGWTARHITQSLARSPAQFPAASVAQAVRDIGEARPPLGGHTISTE